MSFAMIPPPEYLPYYMLPPCVLVVLVVVHDELQDDYALVPKAMWHVDLSVVLEKWGIL